jgi:RimJ/RimL family protein N-acetyltransferase/predicted ester cyclase
MKSIPPVLLTYIAGLKAHDVDKIATTVAEDLRFITQASTVNKGRFLSFLRALYAAFPDWHYDHDEPELRDDGIAVKWRQSGTQSGTLAFRGMAAVPPTGKKVTIPEQFFFYRVRGDQIVEIRPDPIAGGAPQGIFEQIGQRGTMRTAVTTNESVRLRPVQPGDLPRMYDMQLDPESNRMAGTIPRTAEVFDSHWAKVLDDPGVAARAILVGEAFVGTISCFPRDGQDHVGYWIDRAYWGMGIASRSLHLLLREVVKRPLVATVATSNVASLRVLQKGGFVVGQVRLAPADDRHPECEIAVLVLR